MTTHQLELYKLYHAEADITIKFEIGKAIVAACKEHPIEKYYKNPSLTNLDGEVWTHLNYKGLNDFFMVSNLGRCKRLFRIVGYRNGNPKRWEEKILIPSLEHDDVLRFNAYINNIHYRRSTHQCVMLSFCENNKNLPVINHINGDRTDCFLENLEYCTCSHNELHSFRVLGKQQNKKKLGESPVAKGAVEQYSLDGVFIKEYSCMREAEISGYCCDHIGQVIRGERKTHGKSIWKFKN